MYVPKEFSEINPGELLQFMRQNALGIVISSDSEPVACHIPLMVNAEGNEIILEGHLSRANLQLEQLKDGKSVFVIFQGPNTYISSSVYSHVNVPTWNYQAVHVYGTVEQMSVFELVHHLEESVAYFESVRHQKLSFKDFPEDMIAAYLKGICGIKIKVSRMEAAYKMSQNRNEKDYQHIVTDLTESDALKDQEVAEAMKAIFNHKKR